MVPKLTNGGVSLMIRALNGEELTFSKIVIGNGDKPDSYEDLTDLMNPIATIGLDSITATENEGLMLLRGTLGNAEIDAGFFWTEMGVFCKDPDGEDQDILYAYRHYQILDSDDGGEASAVFIPKFGSDIVELTLNVYVYVGEIENVAAVLAKSSEYATQETLDQHIEDDQNPHNVTKKQIGLDNVPNVATNDQTPTYTVESTLTALLSGEKLSTAMGKIAKAVSSLISHIGNKSNPHGVTLSQVGAAAEGHNHSANDITSGTLGIARGGTGGTTAEAAMHSLLGIYAGAVGSTYRITSGKNLNNYITGGTYWCTSAEIAKTLTNCPYTSSNFLLLVFSPSASQRFQLILPNQASSNIAIYFRAYNTDTWGVWRKTTTSAV